MYRKLIFTLMLLAGLVGAGNASAAVPLTDYNALRDVSVVQEKDELLIRFEFKKPLEQRLEPNIYKRSVQLDFLLTYVDPPKRYFPVYAGPISQVYVSQFDQELMRVRFILDKDDGLKARDFRMTREGRFLNVRIPKKIAPRYDEALDRLLERAVGSEPSPAEPEPEGAVDESLETVNDVLNRVRTPEPVAETSEEAEEEPATPHTRTPLVLRDRQIPVEGDAENKPKGQSENKKTDLVKEEGAGGESLWSSAIKMISTLALVVGLMFLIFFGFKKLVLKQGMFGTTDKPIRVLSTGFLGPKKSIALVEVAGKVLVLGVANEQISLLSSLEESEEVQRLLNSHRAEKKAGGAVTPPVPAPRPQPKTDADGKPDIYTRQRKPAPRPAAKPADAFAEMVDQYSGGMPKPKMSPESLRRLIRERMDQIKAGV